jgi:hypothetical protein
MLSPPPATPCRPLQNSRTPARAHRFLKQQNTQGGKKKNMEGENYIHNVTGHPRCDMIDRRVYGRTYWLPVRGTGGLNAPHCDLPTERKVTFLFIINTIL